MAQLAIVGGMAAANAHGQMQAGKMKRQEHETQSKQIETAAAQREADRKDDLARAISSQAAGTGASGITSQGSPLAVIEQDMAVEEIASSRDEFQTRMGSQASKRRGLVAENTARTKAIASLLKTAGQASATGA